MAVLAVDPFGMSSSADRASESIFLKLYSFAYPSRARDDIVVVLYDESDLPRYGATGDKPQWPLPSATHAELLRRILALKPNAVFVDLLFDDERAATTGGTAETLLHAIPPHAAPVLFASLSRSYPHKLIAGLQSLPVFSVGRAAGSAPAYRTITQLSAKPAHYALETDGELTSAAALYEIAASREPRSYPSIADHVSDEMLLAWGSTLPSRYKAYPDQYSGCALYFDDRAGRIAGFLHALRAAFFNNLFGDPDIKGGWNRLQTCPYHNVVSAADFFRASDPVERDRLSDEIGGRYVFIGERIAGIPDDVVSPVNGKLPAVFMHAMALDNLLSFRGDPIHSASAYPFVQAILIFLALLFGGLLFAEEPAPRTRSQALAAIAMRLLIWIGFAVASAALLFAFLLLHWAPYNWGAVFAVSGAAFLSRMGQLILIVISGKPGGQS